MLSHFSYHKKNLIISGVHCSGKSLLLSLLPAVANIDLINKNPLISNIISLHYLKKIPFESAKFLILSVLNNETYSTFKGRKINLNPSDETSLWNYSEIDMYFKRIFNTNKKKLNDKFSVFDSHDVLFFHKFWEKVINFKLINLERNPVDIIHDMYMRNFYSYKKNSYYQITLLEEQKTLIPFYAFFDKKYFLSLSRLDKIIFITLKKLKKQEKIYKSISPSKKKNILRLNFELLKKDPEEGLKIISVFLKSKFNFDYYYKALLRESNHGINIEKDREKKNIFIKKNSSNSLYRQLCKASLDYESKIYNK